MTSIIEKNISSAYPEYNANKISQEPEALIIEQSRALHGSVELVGAKNAVLVIMASLLLVEGVSVIRNVPLSTDVMHMIKVLESLGAHITFDKHNHILCVDTTFVRECTVHADLMKKMRASILVMGPLLARFGRARMAMPGGCIIGTRPIDYHLKNFAKMGAVLTVDGEYVYAQAQNLRAERIVLEYPSVGATENTIMAAVRTHGTTTIVNASLEPEVVDLITVLQKMGALITIMPPATIEIIGRNQLYPIDHAIIMDRLEAGSLLLAAAITNGSVTLPQAYPDHLEVFLEKLQEMGHSVHYQIGVPGIHLTATSQPKAVSFVTAAYPGFPTDLQAPMAAALCLADGKSIIHETVYENRFLHVRELQKMGAQIELVGDKASIVGVDQLYGTHVIATDIRASCALVLAGLVARGKTVITGLHHWQRGYEALEKKLVSMGAVISLGRVD